MSQTESIGVPKHLYDELMKKARRNRRHTTTITFNGDDFITTIKLRDGKLWAKDESREFEREIRALTRNVCEDLSKPSTLFGVFFLSMKGAAEEHLDDSRFLDLVIDMKEGCRKLEDAYREGKVNEEQMCATLSAFARIVLDRYYESQ